MTPLDVAAARLFYRPGALDRWPLAKELPWSVLYRLAPSITASLVRVPVGELERIGVRLRRGNIRVTDRTREGVAGSGRLKLDLVTAAGHVQAPAGVASR